MPTHITAFPLDLRVGCCQTGPVNGLAIIGVASGSVFQAPPGRPVEPSDPAALSSELKSPNRGLLASAFRRGEVAGRGKGATAGLRRA